MLEKVIEEKVVADDEDVQEGDEIEEEEEYYEEDEEEVCSNREIFNHIFEIHYIKANKSGLRGTSETTLALLLKVLSAK